MSPLDRGSLVHETLDAFLAEVLARPGGAPAPDDAVGRRRPRPAARDRRRAVRRLRGAGAHRPPVVLAPRPAPHPRRARPIPHRGLEDPRRLRSHPHRHRTALRLRRHRTRRRHPALRRAHDALPRRRRPRRPHGGRHAVGDRLQDRMAARRPRRRSHCGRHPAAAPRLRPRGTGVVRERRHPGRCRLLVREHARSVPLGRTGTHPRSRRAGRRRAARHRRRHRRRRVPVPGRPAEHVDAPISQLHRSRRPRHPRPVPRMATQAGGIGVARLRRARRTRGCVDDTDGGDA